MTSTTFILLALFVFIGFPTIYQLFRHSYERNLTKSNLDKEVVSNPISGVEERKLLVDEWKEVRESLRYFGNKRFNQLTVFIAGTGLALNVFIDKIDKLTTGTRRIIPAFGIMLCILFVILEFSAKKYWKQFERRGKEIERLFKQLFFNLMHYRLKWNGLMKILTGTSATYLIYWATLILWVLLLIFYWSYVPKPNQLQSGQKTSKLEKLVFPEDFLSTYI